MSCIGNMLINLLLQMSPEGAQVGASHHFCMGCALPTSPISGHPANLTMPTTPVLAEKPHGLSRVPWQDTLDEFKKLPEVFKLSLNAWISPSGSWPNCRCNFWSNSCLGSICSLLPGGLGFLHQA